MTLNNELPFVGCWMISLIIFISNNSNLFENMIHIFENLNDFEMGRL